MEAECGSHDCDQKLPGKTISDESGYKTDTYLNKIRDARKAPVYCAMNENTLAAVEAKPIAAYMPT